MKKLSKEELARIKEQIATLCLEFGPGDASKLVGHIKALETENAKLARRLTPEQNLLGAILEIEEGVVETLADCASNWAACLARANLRIEKLEAAINEVAPEACNCDMDLPDHAPECPSFKLRQLVPYKVADDKLKEGK